MKFRVGDLDITLSCGSDLVKIFSVTAILDHDTGTCMNFRPSLSYFMTTLGDIRYKQAPRSIANQFRVSLNSVKAVKATLYLVV
jgi:hypothetical protein